MKVIWKQFKGNVKQQWCKLSDDQLDVIAGKRDHLAGKIQESYGVSKDEAEKQLAAWQKRQKEMGYSKCHSVGASAPGYASLFNSPLQGTTTNNPYITAILAVTSLAFSAGTMAQSMSLARIQRRMIPRA